MLKEILGYALPVSGESTSDNAPSAPLGMGTSARSPTVLLTK